MAEINTNDENNNEYMINVKHNGVYNFFDACHFLHLPSL